MPAVDVARARVAVGRITASVGLAGAAAGRVAIAAGATVGGSSGGRSDPGRALESAHSMIAPTQQISSAPMIRTGRESLMLPAPAEPPADERGPRSFGGSGGGMDGGDPSRWRVGAAARSRPSGPGASSARRRVTSTTSLSSDPLSSAANNIRPPRRPGLPGRLAFPAEAIAGRKAGANKGGTKRSHNESLFFTSISCKTKMCRVLQATDVSDRRDGCDISYNRAATAAPG